jgi:hypothetical protein
MIDVWQLEEYDRHVMDYEAGLAKRRRAEPFRSFKYFQYLALLYTEVFLDRITAGPVAFLREINAFRASKTDFMPTTASPSSSTTPTGFFAVTATARPFESLT